MASHPNSTGPKDPLSRAAWRLRKTAAKSLRTNLGLHIDPRRITYTEKACSIHGYKWVLNTKSLAPGSVEFKRMKRMAASWDVYPNNWNRMDRLRIAQMIEIGWLKPVSLGKNRRMTTRKVVDVVDQDGWEEDDGLEDDGVHVGLESLSNCDDNADLGMEQRCDQDERENIDHDPKVESASPPAATGSSRASHRIVGVGEKLLISGNTSQYEPNGDNSDENPLIKASRSLDINSKVRSYLALTAELVRDMDALRKQPVGANESELPTRGEKEIATEFVQDELKAFRTSRLELNQKINSLEKKLEHLTREVKEVSPRIQGQNAAFRSISRGLSRGNNGMRERPVPTVGQQFPPELDFKSIL
ncbi:hypothetical protein TWF192_000595 [Orbilia oligospora]|uniref:Uncharacterized protein n=1 Tax=Orbilia oligospora TaxID=2813651 RepID=A0A6G1LVS2_ORBOL|nr:hypothetical protein TWF191_002034 [Orbilia oligospora]KAF3235940.1 hypothetical protein TWF192_000595 [Orbilia oligospora]